MPRINTKSLPHSPGVYMFFNDGKALIYVGKAKNIRKRVTGYFNQPSTASGKLKKLVSEIRDVKYIITDSEHSALLLENNLIKKNQPRYNILLKDGKTYPYIHITKERFPRVISTRKVASKEGEYFGPYTSVVSLNNTLTLLRQMYAIRSCRLVLSKKNIIKKKFKLCLEYHIGNCKGPCVGLQHEDSYNQDIASVKKILHGKLASVTQHLTKKMHVASGNLEFENAAQYKDQIDLLKKIRTESQCVSKHLTAIDVITITGLPTQAFINYMQVKNGSIILSRNLEVVKKLNEPDSDVLSYALHEMRQQHKSTSELVISNKPVTTTTEGIKSSIPKKGEKRKLVALSLTNAFYYRQVQEPDPQEKKHHGNDVLAALKQDLRLRHLPRHIECFDISNFHKDSPVASMVSFTDGKPNRSGYRHYNIRTIKVPNDFAAIYEVVWRRYRRLTDEQKSLPHLIMIDGGKGQLSSACKALKELGLYNKVPIISIAKKLEEIYTPLSTAPLSLDKRSSSLLLIQKIRDEAHDFAVRFHRLKRGHKAFSLNMKAVAGIGDKTTEKLLNAFRSWKKVRAASPEKIKAVIGKHRARMLLRSFEKSSEDDAAGNSK